MKRMLTITTIILSILTGLFFMHYNTKCNGYNNYVNESINLRKENDVNQFTATIVNEKKYSIGTVYKVKIVNNTGRTYVISDGQIIVEYNDIPVLNAKITQEIETTKIKNGVSYMKFEVLDKDDEYKYMFHNKSVKIIFNDEMGDKITINVGKSSSKSLIGITPLAAVFILNVIFGITLFVLNKFEVLNMFKVGSISVIVEGVLLLLVYSLLLVYTKFKSVIEYYEVMLRIGAVVTIFGIIFVFIAFDISSMIKDKISDRRLRKSLHYNKKQFKLYKYLKDHFYENFQDLHGFLEFTPTPYAKSLIKKMDFKDWYDAVRLVAFAYREGYLRKKTYSSSSKYSSSNNYHSSHNSSCNSNDLLQQMHQQQMYQQQMFTDQAIRDHQQAMMDHEQFTYNAMQDSQYATQDQQSMFDQSIQDQQSMFDQQTNMNNDFNNGMF